MIARSSLINKIKVKLEEFSPFDEPKSLVAINNNVKPIDSYIEETLDESCDKVLLYAPLHLINYMIEDVTQDVNTNIKKEKGVGYYDKPSDFLRLYSVAFDKWHRQVNTLIHEDNPLYALQRNIHTRGGVVKPVVALIGNQFELYSVKRNMECVTFKYIPKTAEGTSSFEKSLSELIVLQCAIDILEIFEQTNKVQVLSQELTNLVNSYKV